MATNRRPNIIWIMADDLSWGDLGCYGQDRIKTPHIDRLTAEGMLFTQCHSGSTVCAPSRSSLMQGLHQGHATVRGNTVKTFRCPVKGEDWKRRGVSSWRWEENVVRTYRHSLQPSDTTVAEMLRAAGYATGMFGKWGLAVHDQPGVPYNKGFDAFLGYLNQRHAHSYYPEYLWRNAPSGELQKVSFPQHRGHNHRLPSRYDTDGNIILNGVDDQSDACYSFDVYAEASLEFVRANRGRPFFLYLPYTPPHGELEVPSLGMYTHLDWPSVTHKLWAAMTTRIDDAVGTLMGLLEDLGIDDSTLVFFTSDNGYSAFEYPVEPTLEEFLHNRGPWKGGKGDLHQGGVRVPAIARWPGVIRPSTTNDLIWAFWDFLPTAAEVAGVDVPKGIDGISILPTLTGNPEEQQRRDFLYWEFNDEQAVRLRSWYVYRPHPSRPIQVYDAIEDPYEERDLAADKSDIVRLAEMIFENQHTTTPFFPDPGESHEDWRRRMEIAGIELPNNVDT